MVGPRHVLTTFSRVHHLLVKANLFALLTTPPTLIAQSGRKPQTWQGKGSSTGQPLPTPTSDASPRSQVVMCF